MFHHADAVVWGAMPFSTAHPALLRALEQRGYTEPTPVQAAVLAADATGRDLLVSAQTGSGKTVAFGLAMAPTLLGDALAMPAGPPRALVVAPTRELAMQVQRELAWLYAPTAAAIVTCVGGMDMRREERMLAHGAAIVVGTPGRLRDHLERGNLELDGIAAVVLDEADEMLDMGFREDLEALLDATPPTRRTLLFSATLPRMILALAKRYTRDAVRIATTEGDAPHGDIEYRAIAIAPRERDHAVVNLLRHHDVRGALVFCATREGVSHLAANLNERGFAVVALSGELSQAERTRALTALRDGRARACVATDVAARGLDLPDLGLVIHADLPQNAEVLLHRSGRTGRAGKKGIAVVLVPGPARGHAARLFGVAGVRAQWVPPPSAEEIRAGDRARLAGEVEALARDAGEEEIAAGKALLAERGAEAIATALIRLHRAQLPAPEELTVLGAPVPRPPAARGARGDGGGEPVWFRIDLGRARKADPRWLIPVICQRGGVTKAEIGAIRVMSHETRFEIAGAVADRFEVTAARPPQDHPDRTVRTARIARLGTVERGDAHRGPPPRSRPRDRRT
ncbi:MAG TPA: DEAD/DEAH box helicase [Kofleriaceae bacterium]|nr:DEAD/DEAH box helicase [Kofleriaceae bacterium]